MDEAGRGPWAGPVVAAAVILRARAGDPTTCAWPDFGVRIDDSKRLSPLQRSRAYRVILRRAIVGVGICPAERIDAINIFQATLEAMREAVDGLGTRPELVLVDGQHAPKIAVPCWTIVDGDHLSYTVACASIVAKVLRDSLMTFYHRLFPSYDFHRHKGYGTSVHLAALSQWGPSMLHRMSFRPVWAQAQREMDLSGVSKESVDGAVASVVVGSPALS